MSGSVIDRIFAMFDLHGPDSYGEDVTQLEHALQAATLAHQAGADEALVAAALLHDVGQFIDDAGWAAERHGTDALHEIVGADWLSRHFPPAVTEPIRLHVAAKRYLCATEPGYTALLTRASILSMAVQGGPMSDEEVSRFETAPFFAEGVQLRRFDDEAKMVDFRVPELASYRPLLERLARE
jgi:phosphonate degradation associated HDIG domain protein